MKTFAGRKLGRKTSHRLSLLANLASSLLQHEKIKTTLPKAKELSRYTEKIISGAKRNDLNAHRAAAVAIRQSQIRKKLFDVLVPRYQSRNGGYLEIIRAGQRTGDAAPMAVIRLLP